MGYYVRYLVVDDKELTIEELRAGLKSRDARFEIRNGDLEYGGRPYAEIEVGEPDEEELDELRADVEEATNASAPARKRVMEALAEARTVVVVRLLGAGQGDSRAMESLWEWLYANRRGILQTDDGYYEEQGCVLELRG